MKTHYEAFGVIWAHGLDSPLPVYKVVSWGWMFRTGVAVPRLMRLEILPVPLQFEMRNMPTRMSVPTLLRPGAAFCCGPVAHVQVKLRDLERAGCCCNDDRAPDSYSLPDVAVGTMVAPVATLHRLGT